MLTSSFFQIPRTVMQTMKKERDVHKLAQEFMTRSQNRVGTTEIQTHYTKAKFPYFTKLVQIKKPQKMTATIFKL